MPRFRILYFAGNTLTHWEEQQAADIVQCLGAVSGRQSQRVEVWRGSERVAILKESRALPGEYARVQAKRRLGRPKGQGGRSDP